MLRALPFASIVTASTFVTSAPAHGGPSISVVPLPANSTGPHSTGRQRVPLRSHAV
jgi:hypothetical protein